MVIYKVIYKIIYNLYKKVYINDQILLDPLALILEFLI